MGHGTVADEIKGRTSGDRAGAILAIEEEGVRFRSYVDGSTRFMGPETSMEVQAALGSDIALVFDECTPFHVTRDYTARSTERTHRWLDRCLRLARRARAGVAGRLRHRPGRGGGGPAAVVGPGGRRAARRSGSRSAARSGRTRTQMYEVVGWTTGGAAGGAAAPPARDRRRRRPAARRRARRRHLRLRDADAHRPPRHGARARPRARAGASTSPRAASARPTSRSATAVPAPRARPATRARTCTTCSASARRRRARILTLHNLAFLRMLMSGLRAAIEAGGSPTATAAVRAARRRGRSRGAA